MATTASNAPQSYAPVQQGECEEHQSGVVDLPNDNFRDSDEERINPMEIEESVAEGGGFGMMGEEYIFTWEHSWLPSVLVSLFVAAPAVIGIMWLLWGLIDRVWVTAPFALYLFIMLKHARSLIPEESTVLSTRRCSNLLHLFAEGVVFVGVYSFIYSAIVGGLITEPDGTITIEWVGHEKMLRSLCHLGRGAAILRGLLISVAFLIQRCKGREWERRVPSILVAIQVQPTQSERNQRTRSFFRWFLNLTLFGSFAVLLLSCTSVILHFAPWPAPLKTVGCDILDETECLLPFPSAHHLTPDPSTQTGWRVNLQTSVLPSLKGHREMKADFLNNLDGFSTMAPMLFYIDGLKEAHEAGVGQLVGSLGIENSTSSSSVTLLVDVKRQELVYHSAEVDYLDPDRPLVLLFPAQPLRHNTHYAVAVLNAVDINGALLQQKPGLTKILSDSSHDRHQHFANTLLPALENSASWFTYNENPMSLQLMFDFHTISADSQLGTVRAVRDVTLSHVRQSAWGDWSDHVRVIKMVDYDCNSNGTLPARTVHAEMDVPWFLSSHGPGQRGATMDYDAIKRKKPRLTRPVKFVVNIPCSVKEDAIAGKLDVKAVMEYGHGLFYSRAEAGDTFLIKMAHDERFVITAMDWRGMSAFDLLLVAKVLMSSPHEFEAVRDNLIQGYGAKFALQEFSRKALLSMDWFRFDSSPLPAPTTDDTSFVFYGISQGGILGAGYMGLSGGEAQIIDRGVLGVPGTPFALVMSRSLDFQGYDVLLLLNFYNNRHVRMFLSVAQMAWDPVEASGVLALPIQEPVPPLLIQCGLGDEVVTTIAAEALARATNASTLPNNPRRVFGVASRNVTSAPSTFSSATLTELYYENDAAKVPLDDTYGSWNYVHYCVRKDEMLIKQVAQFVSSGQVIDPCESDGCYRQQAYC